MNYTTVTVAGIITRIAKPTEVKGYTEAVIEAFLPETFDWTEYEINSWIKDNNKRMQSICDFLNENKL